MISKKLQRKVSTTLTKHTSLFTTIFINRRQECTSVSSMDELNTKTIRLTLDAYKILNSEKKKLSSMSGVSYSYSDIILAGLAILDALSEEHRTVVLDLLRTFKKARLAGKSRKAEINIESLFKDTTKNLSGRLSSEMVKENIVQIINILLERDFPGAAMEVLLDNVNIFDEHERNQLSFEILAAMADKAQPEIRENLEKKLEKQ